MNTRNASDKDRERDHSSAFSGAPEVHEAEASELAARSSPLKSTYNSTFILLVLAISAIVALILIAWPAGRI